MRLVHKALLASPSGALLGRHRRPVLVWFLVGNAERQGLRPSTSLFDSSPPAPGLGALLRRGGFHFMCGSRPKGNFACEPHSARAERLLACKHGLVWLRGLDMLCVWACLSVQWHCLTFEFQDAGREIVVLLMTGYVNNRTPRARLQCTKIAWQHQKPHSHMFQVHCRRRQECVTPKHAATEATTRRHRC